MNNYWKQSLWLGGAYWIISLILAYINTFESYMTDFIFSLLLTIFLIPMIFLSPVKWIDNYSVVNFDSRKNCLYFLCFYYGCILGIY